MQVRIRSGVKFVVDGEDVLALVNRRIDRLHGDKVRDFLIPLLGRLEHGVDIDSTTESIAVKETSDLICKLIDSGYLEDVSVRGVNTPEVSERIRLAKILVVGSTELAEAIRSVAAGSLMDLQVLTATYETLCVEEIAKDVVFAVVAVNNLHEQIALKLNKFFVNEGISYLAISFPEDASSIEIGPFVQSKVSGCLECWKDRRLANMTYAYEYGLFMEAERVFSVNIPVNADVLRASFCAPIVLNICQALNEDAYRYVENPYVEKKYSIRLDNFQIEESGFLRNVNCKVCGDTVQGSPPVKQWSTTPFKF